MKTKIGMVSLGCPKNGIDAEIMLKKLQNAGYEITPVEADADVIIINTCGFIEDAKTEAIENIIEAARYKDDKLRALIVTGCLAERYRDEITKEIPEVDVVVGLGCNNDIVEIVKNALDGNFENRYGEKCDLPLSGDRLLTTPPYTAYLKIAEGCDNCCTFCAIPLIRGRFRSRPMEEIIDEAKTLAKGGVKELVLIAQDTTRYGEDNYGGRMLPELIEELAKIDGIRWIRTLYTYPERIDDRLLETLATVDKAVKYLDIPIQHASKSVLKNMNRSGDKERLLSLVNHIRDKVDGVIVRTTVMTGFPGESEEDFITLCEFINEAKFDRLGCFAYSEEEGTPAAEMKPQVDPQIRADRAGHIMEEQQLIAENKLREQKGKHLDVLIEGYDNYIRHYFGRSYMDAPEIDGKIFFASDKPLKIGDFERVEITDILDYDLIGIREGME